MPDLTLKDLLFGLPLGTVVLFALCWLIGRAVNPDVAEPHRFRRAVLAAIDRMVTAAEVTQARRLGWWTKATSIVQSEPDKTYDKNLRQRLRDLTGGGTIPLQVSSEVLLKQFRDARAWIDNEVRGYLEKAKQKGWPSPQDIVRWTIARIEELYSNYEWVFKAIHEMEALRVQRFLKFVRLDLESTPWWVRFHPATKTAVDKLCEEFQYRERMLPSEQPFNPLPRTASEATPIVSPAVTEPDNPVTAGETIGPVDSSLVAPLPGINKPDAPDDGAKTPSALLPRSAALEHTPTIDLPQLESAPGFGVSHAGDTTDAESECLPTSWPAELEGSQAVDHGRDPPPGTWAEVDGDPPARDVPDAEFELEPLSKWALESEEAEVISDDADHVPGNTPIAVPPAPRLWAEVDEESPARNVSDTEPAPLTKWPSEAEEAEMIEGDAHIPRNTSTDAPSAPRLWAEVDGESPARDSSGTEQRSPGIGVPCEK